jgi:hypothetical protein
MRHKWNKEHWDTKGYAECMVCGIYKEKHWPLILFFDKHGKPIWSNKTPECNGNKNDNPIQ